MNRNIFFLFMILLFVSTGVFAQDKLWVTSENATIKAGRTSLSETVARVPVGAELSVVSYENKWYRVFTDSGQNGWIYRGKVAKSPPEINKEEENFLDTLPGTSIQADSSDTSRSIRGLSPETEQYANNAGTPKKVREALDKVLASKPNNKEIETLLKEGKIGEYAQ